MKTISEIKSDARGLLSNNIFSSQWIMILLAVLIVNIIIGFANIIPVVGTIIVLGPLTVGLSRVILLLCRGKSQVDISDLFSSLNEGIANHIVTGLLISIFTFLWSLLFIIPGIVKSYSYSMAYFIGADDPNLDWQSCITQSRKMMNGYKLKLFIMDLSFIGWIIVGAICFGIGTLWVSAYMQTARACFYEDLKKNPIVS